MMNRFHKIDFKKQSLSIAMDLMYNHNAWKSNPDPDPTTPHYHEIADPQTQRTRNRNLKLLAGTLSTLDGFLWEKV